MSANYRVFQNKCQKLCPSCCTLLKSISWTNVITEKNPKDSFNNFFEKLNAAVDISFPEINVKPRPRKFKHSPWMTAGLLISHKQKEKLFAKKVRNPTKSNIESFQCYNNIYSKLRRIAKKLHYDEQFIKFTRNIKQTWSLIREVIGTNRQKDQIPNFFRCNGQILTDYLEITNGFNTFFSQVGPKLATNIPPSDANFNDYSLVAQSRLPKSWPGRRHF